MRRIRGRSLKILEALSSPSGVVVEPDGRWPSCKTDAVSANQFSSNGIFCGINCIFYFKYMIYIAFIFLFMSEWNDWVAGIVRHDLARNALKPA